MSGDKEDALVCAIVRMLHGISIHDGQRILSRAQVVMMKTQVVDGDSILLKHELTDKKRITGR